MKFNPPPNWPQPAAGWSPPPGWRPDPSWPKPPPGWQLWVGEDEFVISPFRDTASLPRQRTQQRQQTQNWYQRTVSVVLLLIFLFPVGLALLWMRRDWSVRRRGLVTAVVGIVALLVAVSPSQPPATTSALSPTTMVGGTSPSAYASTSSQSVSPSPTVPTSASSSPSAAVVATTKSRTPATSAPPKTTAAAPAPVHPSAAPVVVHTTKATQPAPVQTTTAKQSCTPLTNSGKCYTPGEFCRSTDHGKTGIDADGDAIKCVDNDGWRWERT